MYLGFLLILIGIALSLRLLTPYMVIIVFVILMNNVFIKVEEKMLEEQFGNTWLAYKKKTRRWI